MYFFGPKADRDLAKKALNQKYISRLRDLALETKFRDKLLEISVGFFLQYWKG